jgi:hypothetical protein
MSSPKDHRVRFRLYIRKVFPDSDTAGLQLHHAIHGLHRIVQRFLWHYYRTSGCNEKLNLNHSRYLVQVGADDT